jgi:hypothetical protein
MNDLFDTPEAMPTKLQAVFSRWALRIMLGLNYSEIAQMLTETEAIGYTFNYYLDAEPYGLRPIGTPLSQLKGWEEFKEETIKQ